MQWFELWCLWHCCHQWYVESIKQSIDNDIDNPMIGVYYYCYEAVKAIFEKAKGKGKPMSTAESMLSGAIAGSAVVLATHPIWTVNVSGSKMVKV